MNEVTDAAVEAEAQKLHGIAANGYPNAISWVHLIDEARDAWRRVGRHVLAARQPKPGDVERISDVSLEAACIRRLTLRVNELRSELLTLEHDKTTLAERLATTLPQRNAGGQETRYFSAADELLRLANIRIAELEALTATLHTEIDIKTAAERTLSDAYTRLMEKIPGALAPTPGQTVWAATEAALDRLLAGTVWLGEGLTEAQEGMSPHMKVVVADNMSDAANLMDKFAWHDTKEGAKFWRNVHMRLHEMTTALRASAAPKPEPVDWVKIAAECRAHPVAYDKDAIIDGLVAQVEALQARGV